MEFVGSSPIQTLTPTEVNNCPFTDFITTLAHVKGFLQSYKSEAELNCVYFIEEVLFDLGQEFIVKRRVGDYLTSIIDSAYYN